MTGEKQVSPHIVRAWKQFTATGRIDDASVRPEIIQSWQRCFRAGVDPFASGVSRRILNRQQLETLLEKKRDLIDIARPFMINLYQFVKGSGFIVMLADEQCYIMEAMGDTEIMANASELNLGQGASWVEEEVGTNGIGTSLAVKQPIQISGAEHFCQKVQFWTCSAAPIIDHSGQIVGALQMSGPSYKSHQHTLGMVVAAVEAIRNQMRIQERNRELTVLNEHLNNILLTVSDGIIVINQHCRVIQINPVAERILGKSTAEVQDSLITDHIESPVIREMLISGKSYKDSEFQVNAPNFPIHCLSSGKPIKDNNGAVTGGVIFINPIQKIKKLVNRFSGAHANFYLKDIIGASKPMQQAIRLATLAAKNDSHVLLQGESGTGKEVFAQAIHNGSSRRNGPFIAINCGAIPRELVGSELFGYEEGAFTGAQRGGHPGKFELASGGTLFLDEIGDMPLEQQVALLRVLQDMQITRIGGSKVTEVDVRIICATNKSLNVEIAKGNFRQDLFYRLNVLTIRLPALRDRKEDIPLLFNFFLQEISAKSGVTFGDIDPRIVPYLQQYPWPGNVREFQNVLERMVNMAGGDSINLENLPEEILNPGPLAKNEPGEAETLKIKELLANNERQNIVNLLLTYDGNITRVAKEMGISRNSLYKKLHRLKITMK